MTKKDFNVSVIGGGIGGLSLAIGLSKAGVPVDVFEAAPKFAEIGAGISFGNNARNALIKLGLGEEFDDQATQIPSTIWFEWRKGEGDDQELIATTYSPPAGNSSVHRAKFLDAMVKHVPQEISHFGKRLKTITELPKEDPSGKKLRIDFEDGSSHDTDVVIGCDGIHSRVRAYLDTARSGKSAQDGSSPLQWSGSWAWRGLIPTKKFQESVGGEMGEFYAKTPQMFLAKDTHILIFPIDHFETVNVVAFSTDRSQWPERPNLAPGEPWTQESTQEEMIKEFKGWGKDMISILKCMEKPSKWALHQLIPSLKSYSHGNVAVTGDAAHGGTPHRELALLIEMTLGRSLTSSPTCLTSPPEGAMAGQAIEDALFLTRLLSHPAVKASNLETALQVYDKIRLPRANRVLESSLEAGDVYEFSGGPGDDVAKLKTELETRFDWIWNHDHDAEFQEAVKELENRGHR